MADFPFVEQQLAVALHHVVVVGAVAVGRDAHPLHPDFPVMDIAVGIHQRSLAQADALYFSTGQDDAGRVGVHEEVFKRSLLVLDLHGTLLPQFLFFLVHCSIVAKFPIWSSI